ncbi:unnamed protein product [Pelagomonas calceolata]|uniref:ABC transporter domain-containing protein n=1 Tax=Pelagomonas calceolata TaxID=35677 RepID=A0A7S4A6Y4_9STRA|nr:unnamed protein product [Pelagomonas calceolata]
MCRPASLAEQKQEQTAGLSVQWQDLTVGVGPKRVPVLRNLTGGASAGALTAVLGPSGSGKSTLLGTVSARFPSQLRVLRGSVRYDGEAWDRSRHKRRVAFVEQEDALLKDLTVRQTLTFAAALRGEPDPAARASLMLHELNLDKCADQAIGGANIRREISGGQRRRVSIGHELLLDPGLVLLDEPTSGLDSHAAAKIFRILKDLSTRGVAVLATLHQPTDAMFLGFDSLLLLRDGEASYAGDPQNAVAAIAPKPPPKGMPIADYLMEVICGDDAKQATAREAAATTGTISISEEAGPALPWLSQFIILLKRCFLAHRLDLVDPMLLANMFSVMLLSATLWSGQGSKRPRTETSVRDISGLLFLSPVYWAFQLMILALYTFPADRVVVTKERAAGLYSISAYFLARTSVDTLTIVLMSPLLSLIYYFAAGLRPSEVGWHLLTLFLNSLCAHSAGLCIGAWIMNLKRATTLQTVFMLATMMCGGFYVRGVPVWLKWFGDLSFTRYAYGALLKIEYKGAHYDCAAGRCTVLRESALIDARIRRSSVGADLAVLAGFAVAFRLLAFFGLKRNTH